MKMQSLWSRLAPPRRHLQTLRDGWVMRLGAHGGTLEVLHGRVWVTRAGELDDHIVVSGETLSIPGSGQAVVEAWNDAAPALIAWEPRAVGERVGAGVRSALGRCWQIVDPARRIGAGSVAAIVAVVSGALLFGPLSDARSKALAAPAVLHNSAAAATHPGLAGTTAARGNRADADADFSDRARGLAQEARRRPAGPA